MVYSRGNGTISIFHDSQGVLQVCVTNDRNVGSLGVFYGDSPFDFVLPPTLCQLFIMFFTTRLLYFLLKPLRIPKFTCNIMGGILLGPSLLGRNQALMDALFPPRQSQFLILTSLIGVSYFVFLVAIKMDLMMTLRAAKSTWLLGVIPYLASFVTLISILNLNYNPQNMPPFKLQLSRVWLSVNMSASNFPVMAEALAEFNLLATELGQIILSSSVINDAINWILILINRIMLSHNAKIAIGYLSAWILFMIFGIFVLQPLMKLIVRTTPLGKPVKEIFIVLILMGVAVMTAMADLASVSFLMGPVLYGLVIPSGPPLGITLVEKSEVIITEVLLPFFFMSIGIKTNLSVLHNWRKFLTLQGILWMGDLAKLLACVLVSLTYKIKPRHGMVLGLIMNMKGITQLISFVRLVQLKLLDEETFSHLVLGVVLTTSIFAPLVRLLYKHSPRVVKSSTSIFHEDNEMLTIQSTPINSELRIITCVHNEGNVHGITALLEACNPMLESPLFVYVIHLVELLGKSIPILFPINHTQNRKFVSVNYPETNHIMRAFESYSRNSSGSVAITPFVNVAPYKSMHNAVCKLAHDKMVPLIVIPFHENDHIDLDSHLAISIRKTNTTFQQRVPCTLGILVDRFSRLAGRKDLHSKFYFHVGIFFIGGPDDREALSLGIRMSVRETTKVSLFRFVLMNKKQRGSGEENEEEDYVEDMLDEGLIDEFKAARFGGRNVSCYEITVEDGVEVLNAIRGLEGTYDLVMVGRRHNIECLKDVEMATFIENAEILGMIGDMLSSTEFCIGTVPVLVTQHGGDRVCKLDRVGSVNVSQTSISLGK